MTLGINVNVQMDVLCAKHYENLSIMTLQKQLQIDRDCLVPFQLNMYEYHKHLMTFFQRHGGNTMGEWLHVQSTLNCDYGINVGFQGC